MLISLMLAIAVKLTFVGDAICHGPMLEAYRTGTDCYDFSSVFEDVKSLFSASDFVVANLETPIAPDNQGLTRERWAFCSPKEFAIALKEAGVDFVFTANNHCLDRGPEGVKRTIAALDEIGLPHTGTFATSAEAEESTVIDIGGFKIGLMAATYGSNAFSNHQYLNDGNRYMVNLFQDQELSEDDARAWFRDQNSVEGKTYVVREAKRWPDNLTLQAYERIENHDRQRAKIRADVANMKAKNPDFILMGMHAGGQYNTAETKYTKELAAFLSSCGIDWLVGSHEHVVHGSDFSGFRDGRLVTYSLGNFDALSGTWFKPHDKMADWSIAWHVYLTRDASGKARVEKTTFTVLKTFKGEKSNTIRVVPAAELYALERDAARKVELKAGIVEIARRFSGLDFSRESVVLEYEAASAPTSTIMVDDMLPAGNIIVEKVEGDEVFIRQDLRGMREGEDWFYWAFRVKGAAGRTLAFNFTNKYGGGPVGLRGPVVSLDCGKTYAYPLDGKTKTDAFTYVFPADADEVWFYECHPYLQTNWDAFLARHVASRGRSFETDILCKSKKGRNVEKGVFGCLKKNPKHTVLVSSRHHCSESVATYVLEGLLETVLSPGELGDWYRQNVAVMAVPFMDKDGVEEGEQGKNRAPHDHNRDYTEFVHPETKATVEWIKTRTDNRLDVWIDFHCPWIRGEYNEFVYSPLKHDANNRNAAAEVRFDRLLESLQTSGFAYKVADDMPHGKSWNTGGKREKGWSCINWAINVLPGIKLGHTFEIPFASANGNIVTPDKCRALGRDIALTLYAFLEGVDAKQIRAAEVDSKEICGDRPRQILEKQGF